MKLPPEYFENKQEQARIKTVIAEAIPENIYYHNLIIALADLLSEMTHQAFREDIYTRSTSKKYPPET